MILAALSLLTLSLNAQVILEKNPNTNTSSQAMHKAPLRIDLPANQYLVGPFTTDDMDTYGIGARSLGTSAGTSVPVGVLLNSEDFQDYLGGNVVAFRAGFAQENDVVNYFIYQVKVDDDGTVTFGTSQSIPASTTADYSTHDPGWVTTYVADNSSTPIELKLDNGYNSLLIGYTYIQYYSSDYAFPIGVNSNSTSHPFYLNYQNEWINQTSITADMAMQLIVEMPEKTATPTINYTINEDGTTVTIDVEGDGELHMYVDGNEVPFPYTVGRGTQDYELVVTATAKEDGKLISDEAKRTITIPKSNLEMTAEPTLSHVTNDVNVALTCQGDGEVHMYVDGREVPSPWYLERLEEEYTVVVRVTAQEEGKGMSTYYETVTVPARGNIDLTGWTELPGTYNANDVINWGKYIMFVDRFSVVTEKDDHPAKYDYVMREDKTVDARNTNTLIVPVLKTGSVINGYYTETDVELDKDRQHMELNLMNADFQMNLERNGDIYYYTMDRSINSKADNDYIELTKPQHNIDDSYTEMGTFYTYGENFESGVKHRLDTIGAKYYYGEYGNGNTFMTYAPIIWSFGNLEINKRTNWDNDHLHNSYGSSIWQTGVGKVDDISGVVQRQTGNWATWTAPDGKACSLFRAQLSAKGYLPQDGNSDVNVEYEPYMFRIWVVCDSLRNYEQDEETGRLVDRGAISDNEMWLADIYCNNIVEHRETFTETDQHMHYGNIGTQESYDNQLMFGANQGSKPTFIIRFYYRAKFQDDSATPEVNPNTFNANRELSKSYYAAEEGYDPGDPSTSVSEFDYVGEVVSTTYYNIQGMESDKPFDGVNIVVTRFSDGTTSVSKVVR